MQDAAAWGHDSTAGAKKYSESTYNKAKKTLNDQLSGARKTSDSLLDRCAGRHLPSAGIGLFEPAFGSLERYAARLKATGSSVRTPAAMRPAEHAAAGSIISMGHISG